MKKYIFAVTLGIALSTIAFSQPRPAEKEQPTLPKNLPESFKARYEGGIFGSSGKESGTFKLDDGNERVVFYRKDGRLMFEIPYSALLVIYPDSKTGTSTTGNVISHLPLPGAGLASLIKKDTRYLIIRYNDEDVEAEGIANFKFDEKDELLTFITALGVKAKMKQKGDAFYRAKKPTF